MLVFAFDENEMAGFSSIFLTKEEDQTPHLHLNGVIVKPEYQGKGVAKLMLSRAVGYVYGLNNQEATSGFKISLSARTQNPAIYRLLERSSEVVSPDIDGRVKPEHYAIIKKMDKNLKPYLGEYDHKFVVKNAYPSTKVQADIKNQDIKVLFSKLNKYDAYIIFGDKTRNLDFTQVWLGISDYLGAKENSKDQELEM